MYTPIHVNFNVLDLKRSVDFYEKAIGLTEQRRIEGADFTIVYMGSPTSPFQLELTWLHDRTEPYDLGEGEFHLAFRTDDFQASHAFHAKNGWICCENEAMGIYFIQDPDGYWIEILPPTF